MEKKIPFKGCLFDLDGTLIDSLPAVNRAWTLLARKYNLDTEYVLQAIHGRPASDSVNEFLAEQSRECIEQEIKWLEKQEAEDTEGVVAIEGAVGFLNRLNQYGIPWAIVTSGTHPVATARMKAANIPAPPELVTADLITKGKPDPEPFLLGADKIGLDIQECIVFEDAPAGIQAGIASGAHVIVISNNHSLDKQFTIDCIQHFEFAVVQKLSDKTVLKINTITSSP